MNDFPTVRHAVGIGVVGPRIHQLKVGKLTGCGRTIHRDVALFHRGGDGDDLTGEPSLVLKTVNSVVIACDGPKAPG